MIVCDYEINHMLKRIGSDARVANGEDLRMSVFLEIFDTMMDRIQALEAKISEQDA